VIPDRSVAADRVAVDFAFLEFDNLAWHENLNSTSGYSFLSEV